MAVIAERNNQLKRMYTDKHPQRDEHIQTYISQRNNI